MVTKGFTISVEGVDLLIKGVEPFINLLNSKDLVKWRSEWDIIKLSIYEKYTTLLNKKVKKYYKDIERDERLKKKKMKEIQLHKKELRNLGFVHWFSRSERKNKKKKLEDEIYYKTNYVSTDLYGPGELAKIERSIKEKFFKENYKEELKFLKAKLSKEESKKYKSGIEFYISIKYFPENYYLLKTLEIYTKVINLLGENFCVKIKN